MIGTLGLIGLADMKQGWLVMTYWVVDFGPLPGGTLTSFYFWLFPLGTEQCWRRSVQERGPRYSSGLRTNSYEELHAPEMPVHSQAGDLLEKARLRGECHQVLDGLLKCQMRVGRGQKWEIRKGLSWTWRELAEVG